MLYTILPPQYTAGTEHRSLPETAEGTYTDGILRVRMEKAEIAPGRESLRCTWTNLTDAPVACQPEIRVRSEFPYARYLIPAVLVDGNTWGEGKEPKGLALDQEPWVFDYRRTSLPSCTLTENAESYLALMVSNTDTASLVSSCSMIPLEDGRMIHRLLYPCIEGPLTYCGRDAYAEGYSTWVTLVPGEDFVTTAYILTGTPVRENYAAANVQDAALELLGGDFAPRYSVEELRELMLAFAQYLRMDVNGRQMFSIGRRLQTETEELPLQPGVELGWCGQNAMYSRLFLETGLARGRADLIETACSNLDAWTQEGMGSAGLVHCHYDWLMRGGSDEEDVCNLSYAVWELTRAYRIAADAGMDKPHWLRAARSTADFLTAHFSPAWGFGKAWNVETGAQGDHNGTIGAFMIPALAVLWRETGEARYLDCAREACRFYRQRDLDRFMCTAGALDTYCIDKETSGPLIMGGLMLYEIDGDPAWLETARMAAWYFCSWMYHHDTVTDPDSDFARYGYRTLGGTSVSTQHHHIDPWGALVVPYLLQLGRITGDARWKKRARLLWASAIQNVAPREGRVVHGVFRPAGVQNEAYFHCRWHSDPHARVGAMNDWIVAWPQAFIWNTAMQVRDEDFV